MDIYSIPIVDCHHHLWNLDENYYPWLTDRVTKRVCGEYSAIRKNYLMEDFKNDIDKLNVIKTVHVQAEHDFSNPVRETRWLDAQSKLPASNGIPHAIVAWADLAADNLEAILEQHCLIKNVRGIRQMCHEAFISSDKNSNTPMPMCDPKWQAGLKKLTQYDLSFDLQFYYQQVEDAFAVVSQNENVQFIIVHAGQPAERDQNGLSRWQAGLKKMARLPNCVIKISGLGMFDRNWTPASLKHIILNVIDIFGPERCLFGSNFPVDGMMSSYNHLWQAYWDAVIDFSLDEKMQMFSRNAESIYRI